ncbi:TIGR00289 family protein [Candidatus Woesearchaeota archaeon]|nr:TIGR00289 family protein [Candidatus Woesearchaeota archaeon]
MCGIIGIFNRKNADNLVVEGMKIIKNRGKDGFGICTEKEKYSSEKKIKSGIRNHSENAMGHCLHSVVSFLPQPITGKGKFISNCEIYNWKALNNKYKLKAKNDSELLFKLIEKKGSDKILSILKETDGVYAFAYWINESLYLARDIIGIKPVWYSHSNGFAFASEKKALLNLGYFDVSELNPRKIIKYNLKEDRLEFIERDFFLISPENKATLKKIKQELKKYIEEAIIKRVPDDRFGLLLSGGIDSSLIALICKKLGKKFTCYVAVLDEPGMSTPDDLIYAEKVSKSLGLKLKVMKVKLSNIEKYLKKVVPLIEDSNVVKAGVGLTFFAACQLAKKDNIKVIFSGLGSEEIFAGYKRHKDSHNINKECLSGLIKMYERDTYRDDVITMNNNLELRLPFLDKNIVDFALKIPGRYKLSGGYGKFILREIAEEMGLEKEFAWRKKKAAQYGSKFDRAIGKLTKKAGLKYKSEYLRRFYPGHNLRLCSLISSGKDSIYATYVMMRQNYLIKCLATVKSKNPYSYMFHTPNIDMVKLQAESMGIPLLEQETKGEKEHELDDLEKLLLKAKQMHKIDGVITGAIFSSYQRDRIEKICDRLGLKIFSPLWHINQETEIREIVNNNFNVIISSVAAYGLDKNWLGKRIDNNMIDKLVEINNKTGINVAFEGGEAETLVIDCPMFKKRIKIKDSEIIEEDENTARLLIKKAVLEDK